MMIENPSFLRKAAAHLITGLFLFAFPAIRKKYKRILKYIPLKDIFKAWQTYRNPPQKFKYQLSILACAKDEGEYILEWLEYYLLQGVEHFYLYNNEGTDDTKEKLKPYIEKGIVSLTDWPGKSQQILIYQDGVNRAKEETKWLAIVDIDEFIVPLNKKKFKDLLPEYDTCNQILIPWVIYGSSGHKKKTDGLVIERFTKHQKGSHHHTKAIVNPRSIIYVYIHYSYVFGKTFSPDKKEVTAHRINKPLLADILRINHYAIKSKEEFTHKQNRGTSYTKGTKYLGEYFARYDRNEVDEPDLMKNYAIAIRKNLKMPPVEKR